VWYSRAPHRGGVSDRGFELRFKKDVKSQELFNLNCKSVTQPKMPSFQQKMYDHASKVGSLLTSDEPDEYVVAQIGAIMVREHPSFLYKII
jgi:hypothetical protein